MHEQLEVIIVVDPQYGGGLRDIAADGPVWVVDTPHNRRAWGARCRRFRVIGLPLSADLRDDLEGAGAREIAARENGFAFELTKELL